MRFNLLTTNAKLDKLKGTKYLAVGLALAPAKRSGYNVCESATPGCISACNLWFAGRTVTSHYREAAVRRTKLLFEGREGFEYLLRLDLAKLSQKAAEAGLRPLWRPNIASDLDWTDIIREHRHLTAFDYSKVWSRALGELPDNYHITLSWNERMRHNTARAMLDRGRNVAIVFDVEYNPQHGKLGKLPDEWRIHGKNFPVVDGDKHDFRIPEEDGRGVIVGLRLKGNTAARKSAIEKGFAVTP